MRLTDLSIKALKTPEKGAIIYPDDILSGFGVRVSEGGTKSFVLTHGPLRRRETIGRVGILGLADARGEAKRRLAEYTLGKTQPRATSWSAALEEYLREFVATHKARTHRDYARVLRKHFRFGDLKLSQVNQEEIERKLARLSDTPSERHHAFVVLQTFLRWAHRKNYLDTNPMERMRTRYRYKPRERILSDDELRRVWIAAGDGTFGSIVKLLILSGQRVGEVSKLTPSMVGENIVTLPSSLTKNGRAHAFPVASAAQALLRAECTPVCPPTKLLFPARGRPDRPFNGFSKSKAALDRASDVTDWTLHDLRRTFASGLASLGVPIPVVEKLLNHVSGTFSGIVGVYQRYDFMPEMREAVEKWEKHVLAVTRVDR